MSKAKSLEKLAKLFSMREKFAQGALASAVAERSEAIAKREQAQTEATILRDVAGCYIADRFQAGCDQTHQGAFYLSVAAGHNRAERKAILARIEVRKSAKAEKTADQCVSSRMKELHDTIRRSSAYDHALTKFDHERATERSRSAEIETEELIISRWQNGAF